MTIIRRADFSRPASRIAFSVLLLTVLLLTVYLSAKRGLADRIAEEPRYQVKLWHTGKRVPERNKVVGLQDELTKARNLDPENPSLLEDIGRFHALSTERGKPYDPDVRAARQRALESFRRALQLRPVSGDGFVNVAWIKYRLGEIDQELVHSLHQALRRGPWEPRVQLVAIELGLATWQALADSDRETLKQAIRAQAQWQFVRQKPALQALLKRYRRTDLAYLLE